MNCIFDNNIDYLGIFSQIPLQLKHSCIIFCSVYHVPSFHKYYEEAFKQNTPSSFIIYHLILSSGLLISLSELVYWFYSLLNTSVLDTAVLSS